MTTTTFANWFISVALIAFAVLILRWQIRRARAADAERNRLLFGSTNQPGAPSPQGIWADDTQAWADSPHQARAVLDVEPGINLALADECELLYSMDAQHPGLDRLRTAIRDEQQKGETS